MYKKLLIANDGSDGARKALAAAIQLAKRFRTQLHMLSVEGCLDSRNSERTNRGGFLTEGIRPAD